MNAQEIIASHSHIIVFDGVCNVCAGWVKFVHKRDAQGRFHFASIQSDSGRALMQWAGLDANNVDTMLYVENGVAYTRSTAFLKIIRHFPDAWPLLSQGLLVPVFARDFFYNRFAQNRYRLFGQSESCLIPDAGLATRFL
ncbi:MAG: thiol-disulfide oxidoreductase DCC family protein [Moraxellaceae bacterium]